MKTKKVPLAKLKLRNHPKLNQLISHDQRDLSSSVNVQNLTFNVAQTLLDLSPVLACKNEKNDAEDWQLNSNLVVEILKQHPDKQKLNARVYFYPGPLVDDVLIAALMIFPAINYRQQNRFLHNLFYRTQQANAIISKAPARKVLADWAKVSSSAIRPR